MLGGHGRFDGRLPNFRMVLAYSSYSRLVFDVTSGHMTLRFEIARKKLAGIKHNLAECSDITTCMWEQLCIGHFEV